MRPFKINSDSLMESLIDCDLTPSITSVLAWYFQFPIKVSVAIALRNREEIIFSFS